MQYHMIKIAEEKRAHVCNGSLVKEHHFSFRRYFHIGYLGRLYSC